MFIWNLTYSKTFFGNTKKQVFMFPEVIIAETEKQESTKHKRKSKRKNISPLSNTCSTGFSSSERSLKRYRDSLNNIGLHNDFIETPDYTNWLHTFNTGMSYTGWGIFLIELYSSFGLL